MPAVIRSDEAAFQSALATAFVSAFKQTDRTADNSAVIAAFFIADAFFYVAAVLHTDFAAQYATLWTARRSSYFAALFAALFEADQAT